MSEDPSTSHEREPEPVKAARKIVHRQLGSELARKATADFCLSFAGSVGGPGLEAFGAAESLVSATAQGQRAVIELKPAGADAPHPASGDFARELAHRSDGSVAGRVVSEAMAASDGALAASERALALLARQAAIRTERDGFYREMGPLRDDIERSAAALSVGDGERPRLGVAASPVIACWLNRTIRAEAHASVLGDVASHTAVELVDVPRRLAAEAIDVTVEAAETLREAAGLSGAGVTVGVIDSEVQLRHPALQDRVIHRRNYTQEPFGVPGAHGTAVAGIIAARSPEVSGIAPEALIYNYKVLATNSALNGEDFEAALAIQHALEDGVRVVNCSWGAGLATDGTSREARACDAAWRLGLTIVKSAGNRGPGPVTLTTPADAEGVIVVGATSADGLRVPDYSSRGPTPAGVRRPHVLAPGGEFGAEVDGILLGGGTGSLGEVGTSFAAPHVAGLIALLLEREPELTPDQQRTRIVGTCRALAGLDPDTQGAGLVDPAALFAAVGAGVG